MIDPNVLSRSIALLILIGLAAWWFFEARGNMKNETAEDRINSALRRVLWFFAIVLVVVCMIAYVVVTKAFAHDHNRPMLNDWLKSLQSKSKALCCDGNDTDALDDWETMESRYRVKFRGEWYDVPESAIVDGPNKGGDALLWMNKGYTGFSVRCFMPGSMT